MKVSPSEDEFRTVLRSLIEHTTPVPRLTTVCGGEYEVFAPVEVGKDCIVFNSDGRRKLIPFFSIESILV
jgi:hypothetical protein